MTARSPTSPSAARLCVRGYRAGLTRQYWEVELESVAFGKETMELENTGAAIDTGTSCVCGRWMKLTCRLIALPTDIAEILNKEIGATKSWNGQYTVDCAKIPDLPDLTFTFGGKKYPISASECVGAIAELV